tara:strand:+ start:3926 stop:4375 length:450 start_codon:yes stop_codon:yes gene_type:complete
MSHPNPIHLLYFVILCFYSINASSEIFQWTDQHGQTHFGDRAPEKTISKNISDQVKQINITGGLSSPEMMLRYEQSKEAETKRRNEESQEKYKNKPTKAEKCKEMRQLLNIIKKRVIFVDENGKDLNISEETREQRVKTLEKNIREYCE